MNKLPVPMKVFAVQILSAIILGLAGALTLVFASTQVFDPDGTGIHLVGPLASLPLGYALGSLAGVYLIGQRYKLQGSMRASLAGVGVGLVLFLLLAFGIGFNRSSSLLIGSFLTIFPLFAILGYYFPQRRGASSE